jgi:hypothetical protein
MELAASNQRRKAFVKRFVTGRKSAMKNFLWLVGGLCGAAAGFLVLGARRVQPVEVLAHKLEDAWADNHTVV